MKNLIQKKKAEKKAVKEKNNGMKGGKVFDLNFFE